VGYWLFTWNIIYNLKLKTIMEKSKVVLTLTFSPTIYKWYTILVQNVNIERFIKISGHQMSTSSSSIIAFLAWTTFDALHQCLISCYTICPDTDILKNKVDESFCFGLCTHGYFLPWLVVDICRKWKAF
jgi:hypothetical protein